MKFHIIPANDGIHKYVGVFDDKKHIPFGAKGYEDYTMHKNKLRRERYLNRHRSREDWTNPQTAGALSKYILWGESTNLQKNIQLFKKRFNLN